MAEIEDSQKQEAAYLTHREQTLEEITDSLKISIYDHFQQYDFSSTGFIKRESVPTLLFQMMSKVKATSDYAHLRTQTTNYHRPG